MGELVEVVITLPFPEGLVKQLRDVSPRLKVEVVVARKTEELPEEVLERVEVLYTNRVLPTIEQAPHLKWIQFHWAGIDHALDAPILQQPGLSVTTLSGTSASQMAEHAVMMMLALGHHLPEANQFQRHAEWPAERRGLFDPQELRGSTVGIVGYGSIGRQIARLLLAFGAVVLATKRDVKHPEDTGYTLEGMGDADGDLVHRLYPPEAVRQMLKECDFVVITVPRTPETRGMLGADVLAVLKPSAYLVDISRGGVVDQGALIPMLRERKIAGAALDVFPSEPLPADSPLWKFPNVIITPHVSGFSRYYDERAVTLFAENLHRYLANLPLYNQFYPERGY